MADSCSCGPRAHRDVEVVRSRAGRARPPRPPRRCTLAPQPGPRRREVGDGVDADRRAAVAGLDDVRARRSRHVAVGGERRARQRRQAGGRDDRAEGQLVHAEGGARLRRAGVADAGEVERPLQRCRPHPGRRGSSSPPRRSRWSRACAGRSVTKPPPVAATSRTGVAPGRVGHAVERARLEPGVDAEPVARLRPVEGGDRAPRLAQRLGGLEPGEDAHVVLGRRAAEDHRRSRHGMARRLRGSGRGGRSRRARRRRGRGPARAPTPPPAPASPPRAPTPSGPPRPPAGPCGWCDRRRRGRSRAWPPARANAAFSSCWRGPSSTMPGVTTMRRLPSPARPRARRGRAPRRPGWS